MAADPDLCLQEDEQQPIARRLRMLWLSDPAEADGAAASLRFRVCLRQFRDSTPVKQAAGTCILLCCKTFQNAPGNPATPKGNAP
ncbi:hypothetical protein BB934_23995 [Microvirga ossetica]|uniref:Uncharacterized protein n=1 Tax=Microvirga ossetica TaxID=1882682 RepID=A0A1B2ELS6_9HYPH|nr:hypothetical protein BB934_23995 [Microvirga ossetica]